MTSSVLTRLLRASSALTPVILATLVLAPAAIANPVGGTVTAGKAEITAPDPSTLVINQSTNRAIIDWQKFDIDPGETTRFIQPSSDSWALNRVIGSQDPSRILGTLQANGNVVIVNPDGIHFGPGSRVDVNRLIATTSGISNNNFMSGNMIFDQPGSLSASIVNEGTITINDYGLGALVAPSVRNSGVITARLGQISLASGNTFTIDPYGDGLVKLSITDEIQNDIYDVVTGQKVTDLIKNDGTLKADGGIVAMTAATARKIVNSVVNNTGIIEANTIGMRGGKIILGAQTSSRKRSGAPKQVVRVSGKLSATAYPIPTRITVPTPAPEGRGKIEITGEVIVATNATLDASGIYGGGTILIGGDYMGGNGDPNTITSYNIPLERYVVPTASEVALDDNVTITADGIENADGGKVIVWSDIATYSAADISARGGEEGGDGGFIETSGHYLNVLKAADASAPNGAAGTWLLDPLNLELKRVANNNSTVTPGVTLFTNVTFQGTTYPTIIGDSGSPNGANSIIDTAIIENSLNNGTSVRVITIGSVGPDDGDILLSDDIQKTAGGEAIFNINAVGDIIIAPGVNITSTSGKLHFWLYASFGNIIANNIGTIDDNGGDFHMEARDGISISSTANMPNDTGVSLNSGVSPNAKVEVDISFGSDNIKFSHDNNTVTFEKDAIQLPGATPTGGIYIHLKQFDVALADGAVKTSNNRLVAIRLYGNQNFAAINGNNDIPEIESTDGTGTVRLEYHPGATVPANQPVIEVAATNAPNCVGLDCVAPGVPPAVVTTTPTPFIGPIQSFQNPETRLESENIVFGLPQINEDANSHIFDLDIVASGLTPGLEQLARDILAAYGNDTRNFDIISKNAVYAELAAAAYKDTPPVSNWNATVTNPSGLGFSATVFTKKSNKNEIVISFRGTDNLVDWIGANRQLVTNSITLIGQMNKGLKLAREVLRNNPDASIKLVGHSLGGGIAQYVASELNLHAVVFDPAPIAPALIKAGKLSSLRYKKITTFRGESDPLTASTGKLDIGPPAIDVFLYEDVDIKHSMSDLVRAMKSVSLVNEKALRF